VSKSSNLIKPPVSSKLLSRKPTQDSSAGHPGQAITLLPDGKILRTGGLQEEGPTSTASIDDIRFQLQRARAWHTATMLPNGNVLIVGGIGSNGAVDGTIEVFNLETKTSEILVRQVTPRVYHTATLLTDGLVLIAGGLSSAGVALKSAELWDFRSTAVTSEVTLRTARYNHTASLLPNGRVLFTGGSSDEGALLESRELYDPSNHRFTRADAKASIDSQPSTLNPRLSGSLPEDGAGSVPLNSLVALRFSKPLRPESVNTTTLVLTGPQGPVGAKVIPAEFGMLTFVTPNAPLLPGVTYSTTLAGALDVDGSIVEQATITFTTMAGIPRDRVWIPGENNFNGDWTSGLPRSPWQDLPAYTGPQGLTALAGQVLRIDGWPLEHVTMRIGDRSASTDDTGRFVISDIEAGRKMLIVDCRPASTRKETYGLFMIAIDVPKREETNVLPFTIFMPVLDTKHAIKIGSPNKKEVVATNPLLPGLEVHIPPKSILRDFDGNPLTSITITPVPLDRGPFPGPPGARFPMFFTLQLGGTKIESADGSLSPGIKLVFPNYEKTPPGTRIVFWSYAADGVGWFTYGNGTVTADGKHIVPDPGVTISLFTCASIGSPTEPDGPQDCTCDADPVNLGTGLFVYSQADLILPDIIPISLTRIYRPNDPKWRPFGSGTRHPYEMFLVGDQTNYSYADLILPDGGKIRFNRISPGTGPTGAIMEATTTATAFYKSTLTFYSSPGGSAEGRWDLRLKDGTIYRFTVDQRETAPLVAIIDRNGNQLSVVRTNDFTGTLQSRRITRIVSPNGRWIAFTYDANFHITQAKDNIGRTVNYTYDGSGRLTQVTDVGGGITQYTYDAANRMLTIRDARGIVYLTNQYDTNGRIILQTQADSTTYQLAYTLDSNGKVTQTDVTNPRGNHRIVTFNSSGLALTDTKGCSCGSQVTYERQIGTDFVTAMVDALNHRTEYTYDSMGNVTGVTQMAGTSEAVTTSFAYEPTLNQVTSVTDPLNHTTSFAYDSKGNLASVTDVLNHQTTFTYNAAGQRISTTDALGSTAQFAYDGGDLISVTNPRGQASSRFVDAAGRVLSVTNPLGQTARFEYDALNRMTRVTDPLQGVTQFSYDPNGNLLSLTDARNNVTSYVYNNMDRVQTRTDPLNHAESYQYNQNGNLSQHTDRKSQVTNYTYDSLDRLSQVTYADNSTISYAYDAVSRLVQVTDSISGTISSAYDNMDRLLSETTPQGTVSYTYDSLGRRATMAVPNQSVINYSHDNANRLTQITQGSSTVSFAYDNADRRTSVTLPNGVVTEYSYDTSSQLISLTYKKAGNTLGNLVYEYDSAGRRASIGGTFSRTGLPGSLTSASYNAANQQTTFGSQTLTFDLNGNLTSDGTNSYTWNARNQLVSMSGGVSASFQYDAASRRRAKTIAGVTTTFLYDGVTVAQEQSSGTAGVLSASLDEFLTRSDASGTTSFILDALGSTVALTDSLGAVQTQYTYEPFGSASLTGTASGNASQYTGRDNDGTGVYYYRARYYLSSSGRFISEDPIGLNAGPNVYAYVGNNPIALIDPLGLNEKSNMYWLGAAGTVTAGFGDSLTFAPALYLVPGSGGTWTGLARRVTGASGAVDSGSWWYTAGQACAVVWSFAFGAAVAAEAGASKGIPVYRVWGDGAKASGRSWTTVNPGSVANYRDVAGLPAQNTGRFVSEGVLRNSRGCVFKIADSLAGNRGGLPEVVIPDPARQVVLTRVSGVNPPF
jgi:RHS repeat-associated protein